MKEEIHVEKSKENYVDKKNIVASDVVVVIMSKSWEQDPLRIQELEIAKQNNIPVAALVLDNVDEKKYLAGADVLAVKKCSREDSEKCISELNEIVRTELERRRATAK